MGKRHLARECALKILYAIDVNETSKIDDCISKVWSILPNYSNEVKEYAEELVRGAFKYKELIDKIISNYIRDWTLDRISIIDRNILRLGIYELLYEALDDRIIMDEAIEIAKKYGSYDSFQFINAIMDAVNKNLKNKEKKIGNII